MPESLDSYVSPVGILSPEFLLDIFEWIVGKVQNVSAIAANSFNVDELYIKQVITLKIRCY